MSQQSDADQASMAVSWEGRPGKFLTFKLGAEEYGIEIMKVQEIIGLMEITPVPRTPVYVKGVINLRGKVIPVVDLRVKFNLDVGEATDRTCIIVVQINRLEQMVTMGVVVDEVSEVQDIRKEQLEPPPCFGTAVNTRFIQALCKLEKTVVLLLEIDEVLTAEEVELVGDVARSP